MQASDILTHIRNPEDVKFLRIPLFDVNMRLFNCNPDYRNIIQSCCAHIKRAALSSFEDYTRPFGASGANVGIPFNIIGYVVDRDGTGGAGMAYCEIMINPKIWEHSKATHVALSNCGSIRLPKPIRLRRADWVNVRYFNEAGEARCKSFDRTEHGDTIQHEVDHNKGILITDLAIPEDAPQGEV